MTVSEWIRLASTLDVQGLEWHAGFLEMANEKKWPRFRREVEDTGKVIPMMCCSPDFTHPDAAFREKEIAKQKRWIDMTHTLGGSYCRLLSGQRRPELTLDEGVKLAADSIHACLPYAQERGITLILENHYKDDFWEHPEFAQKMHVFCKLVDAVNHPNFGVNHDPSNTYLAGEYPIELLKRVSHRVVTMHASDRYLAEGHHRRPPQRGRWCPRLCQTPPPRRDRQRPQRLRRHLHRAEEQGLQRLDQHRRRRRWHGAARAKCGVSEQEDRAALAVTPGLTASSSK